MAVGFAIIVLGQVFINIGVNIRLLPVTGIPLPFISQGGSSLISLFLGIGIMQSIIMRHRQATELIARVLNVRLCAPDNTTAAGRAAWDIWLRRYHRQAGRRGRPDHEGLWA